MSTKRDKYAQELAPMLHEYGAYTRTAPTVNPKKAFMPIVRSSADTYFLLNGGGAIETKTGHSGTFPFNTTPKTGAGWRQDQIEWAIEFKKQSGCEYWLFVVFETEEGPWRVARDAFLVPFTAAYELINLLPQSSLPYKVRKGMNIQMQENSYDANTLWNSFRLEWKSGWKVPESHAFHIAYIASPQATHIEMIEQHSEVTEHVFDSQISGIPTPV